MIVLSFFIILYVTVFTVNKRNNVENAGETELEFPRNHSIIILALMVFSIVLEFVSEKIFTDFYWIILLAFAIFASCVLTIANASRDKRIKKQQELVVNIYSALSDVLGKLNSQEDIDYSNLPFDFQLGRKDASGKTVDKDKLWKITIRIEDQAKFNDNRMTSCQYSLNSNFPHAQWIYDINFPNKEATFEGQPLPPNIANYPGSDFRPAEWIPLGLSGAGEVCWKLSGTGAEQMNGFEGVMPKSGISAYVYEDGQRAGTVNNPNTPMTLTLGSTGGGKSVYINQEVEIEDR